MGIVGTGMLGTVMSPEEINKAKLKPINQRKKESTSSLAEDHSRAASRRTQSNQNNSALRNQKTRENFYKNVNNLLTAATTSIQLHKPNS